MAHAAGHVAEVGFLGPKMAVFVGFLGFLGWFLVGSWLVLFGFLEVFVGFLGLVLL